MSMPILPSTPVMIGVAAVTVAAIAGTIHGIATGAPVIPAVTIGLYAIGTLRILAQRAKRKYVAYKSDNFFLWVASPVTVPLDGISILLDTVNRFRDRREEQAERAASEDKKG